MTNIHMTNQLHFVVVPEGPDTFLVMADPRGNAVPPGGMVVLPTLLAERYWAEPQRLRVGAGS